MLFIRTALQLQQRFAGSLIKAFSEAFNMLGLRTAPMNAVLASLIVGQPATRRLNVSTFDAAF